MPVHLVFRALPTLAFIAIPLLHSQTTPDAPDPSPVEVVHPAPPISDDRILGVIPNFQTVSDPNKQVAPLRVRDKWMLFVKETVDPYTIVSAALGAGFSQLDNDTPKYGNGIGPYGQRFGAAMADLTTQNFFSDAVLASVFHEDPRYYRKGPGTPVLKRVIYSMSRIVITRRDDGTPSFNYSGVLGMGMGIALSNSYYPARSVNGAVMEGRLVTSFTGAALGNLLPEFWPDVKQKFTRHKQK